MADWSKPTITSNYVTFVDEVKNRDIDAITLQRSAIVNPPVGSVKLVRMTPYPSIKFQEWNGSAFNELTLSVEGGGTGANSLAGLGSAMGLGTMAYQSSTAISVTGGYMNTVRIDNPTFYGNVVFTGGNWAFSSTNTIPVSINGNNLTYMLYMVAPSTFPSHGMVLRAGTGSWDEVVFALQNGAGSIGFLTVRGNGAVYVENGLRIPVGVNKWIP